MTEGRRSSFHRLIPWYSLLQ